MTTHKRIETVECGVWWSRKEVWKFGLVVTVDDEGKPTIFGRVGEADVWFAIDNLGVRQIGLASD